MNATGDHCDEGQHKSANGQVAVVRLWRRHRGGGGDCGLCSGHDSVTGRDDRLWLVDLAGVVRRWLSQQRLALRGLGLLVGVILGGHQGDGDGAALYSAVKQCDTVERRRVLASQGSN